MVMGHRGGGGRGTSQIMIQGRGYVVMECKGLVDGTKEVHMWLWGTEGLCKGYKEVDV